MKVRQGLRRDDVGRPTRSMALRAIGARRLLQRYLHFLFIDPEVIAFSVVRLSPRGGKTAAQNTQP
jgi:hypothetical protein